MKIRNVSRRIKLSQFDLTQLGTHAANMELIKMAITLAIVQRVGNQHCMGNVTRRVSAVSVVYDVNWDIVIVTAIQQGTYPS